MPHNTNSPFPTTPKGGAEEGDGSWFWGLFSTTKKKKKTPEEDSKPPAMPRMALPPIQLSLNGGSGGAVHPTPNDNTPANRGASNNDMEEEEEDVFHSPDPYPDIEAMRNMAAQYFNGSNAATARSRVSFHPSTNGTPGRPQEEDAERDLMTFTPAAKAPNRPSSLPRHRFTDETTKKSPHKVGTRTAARRTYAPSARSSLLPQSNLRRNTLQASLLRLPPPQVAERTEQQERERANIVGQIIREYHKGTNVDDIVVPRPSPRFIRPVTLNRRSWITLPPPPSCRPPEAATPASNSNKRLSESDSNEGSKRKKVAFAPLVETVSEDASPSNDEDPSPAPYNVQDRRRPPILFDPYVEVVPGVILPTILEMEDAENFDMRFVPFDQLEIPRRLAREPAVWSPEAWAEQERLMEKMTTREAERLSDMFHKHTTDDQMADEPPPVATVGEGWDNLPVFASQLGAHNSWKCDSCLSWNALDLTACISCTVPRSNAAMAAAPTGHSLGSSTIPVPPVSIPGGVTFGVASAAPLAAALGVTFGASNSAAPPAAASGVTFGVSSSAAPPAASSGFSFGASNSAAAPAAASGFSFGVSSSAAPGTSAASGVTFGVSTSAAPGTSAASGVTFGASTSAAPPVGAASSFSFGAPANNTEAPNGSLGTSAIGSNAAVSTSASLFSFASGNNSTNSESQTAAPFSFTDATNTKNSEPTAPPLFFSPSTTNSSTDITTDANPPPSAAIAPFGSTANGDNVSAPALTSDGPQRTEASATHALVPASTFGGASSDPSVPSTNSLFGSKFGSDNGSKTSGTSFGSIPSEAPSVASSNHSQAAPPSTTNAPSQPFSFGSGPSFNANEGRSTNSMLSGTTGTFTPAPAFGDTSSRSERIENPQSTKKKRRDPSTDGASSVSTEMPPPSTFGGLNSQTNIDSTGNTSSLFNFGQTPGATSTVPPNAPSATSFSFASSSNNVTTPSTAFGTSTPSVPNFGAPNSSTAVNSTTPSLPPTSQSPFVFGAPHNPAVNSTISGNPPGAAFSFGSSNTSSVPPPPGTSTPALGGGFGSFASATPAPLPSFGSVGSTTNAFGMSSGMDTMESSSSVGFAAPAPFAPSAGFPPFGATAPSNTFTPNVGGFGQPQPSSNVGFNTQTPAFGAGAPSSFAGANAGGFGSAPPSSFDGGFQVGTGGASKRRVVRARRPH